MPNKPFPIPPRQPRGLAEILDSIRERKAARPKKRTGLVVIDGKSYRTRRGILVEIPPEWVGHVTHKQTIRKRDAKKGQGPSYKSKAQR